MENQKNEYILLRVNATEGPLWRVILAVDLFSVLPVEKQDFIINQIERLLPTGEGDLSGSRSSGHKAE